MVGAAVPALASFSSWPRGLVRERSLCWLTLESYINNEHFNGKVIPTPGFFLVLASRLMYENKAYSWSITCTTLVSLLVVSLLLPSPMRNANVAYHWIEQQAMALPFVLQLNWPATPTDHLSAV